MSKFFNVTSPHVATWAYFFPISDNLCQFYLSFDFMNNTKCKLNNLGYI